MTDQTLGLAIIGTGRVASSHANAATQVDGVELRAVAEVDEARRAEWLVRYGRDGAVAGYDDYHDLLARDDIDLAIITLPHWLHAEVAVESARAGKHALVEKVMALTLDECDQMIDEAKQANVRLAVGQTHHFHPVPVAAKRLLDSGRFGRIAWGSEVAYSHRRIDSSPLWFFDRQKGGGQLLGNGVHFVDRLLWTIGGPADVSSTATPARARPVSVNAIVGIYFNQHEPAYRADDGSMLLLRFDTGQAATMHLTGHYQGISTSYAEYVCAKGMVRYSGRQVLATNPENPEDREYHEVEASGKGGFVAQLEDVAGAIRQGRQPGVPGEWGRLIVQILLAAEESSRSGREVRLD